MYRMHECREGHAWPRAAPTGLIQIALGRSSPYGLRG